MLSTFESTKKYTKTFRFQTILMWITMRSRKIIETYSIFTLSSIKTNGWEFENQFYFNLFLHSEPVFFFILNNSNNVHDFSQTNLRISFIRKANNITMTSFQIDKFLHT